MATSKQQMIDGVAVIAAAQVAVGTAIKNIRDANTAIDQGGTVGNATVAAVGNSRGAIEAYIDAQVMGLKPLADAVDAAIVAADTLADGLA